jgi:hypothetical protein
MRHLLPAAMLVLFGALLWATPAWSSKVIEPWRIHKGKPPEKAEPTKPQPPETRPQTETQPGTEPGSEQAAPKEQGTDAEGSRLAEILRAAAVKSGLTPTGDVAAVSGESLKPPAEGEPPAAVLPDIVSTQPVADYQLVALAAGEFAHPTGQTLRAALLEMANPADAWGFFSRDRGDAPILGLGQAANYGRGLRLWKGSYAVVLSTNPPDPTVDKIRLTKLGRDISLMLQGTASPPEMVGWLPTVNLLAHTVTYFHANGPISSETLGLSAQTEGVAGEYEVGEDTVGGIIVRYPDREAALGGWAAFVSARVAGDPSSGTPGSRRVAPEGGRWNGIRSQGRVCAFVVGAVSRNQAEIFLAQAIGKAHD